MENFFNGRRGTKHASSNPGGGGLRQCSKGSRGKKRSGAWVVSLGIPKDETGS